MSKRSEVILKSLQTRKYQVKAELEQLNKRKKDISDKIKLHTEQLKSINEELNKIINDDTIILTEHAILRYLERTGQIDLAKIQNEILTDDIRDKISVLKNCKIPHNSCTLVVKNKNIVSVIA